jgi:hypothetical protein
MWILYVDTVCALVAETLMRGREYNCGTGNGV